MASFEAISSDDRRRMFANNHFQSLDAKPVENLKKMFSSSRKLGFFDASSGEERRKLFASSKGSLNTKSQDDLRRMFAAEKVGSFDLTVENRRNSIDAEQFESFDERQKNTAKMRRMGFAAVQHTGSFDVKPKSNLRKLFAATKVGSFELRPREQIRNLFTSKRRRVVFHTMNFRATEAFASFPDSFALSVTCASSVAYLAF